MAHRAKIAVEIEWGLRCGWTAGIRAQGNVDADERHQFKNGRDQVQVCNVYTIVETNSDEWLTLVIPCIVAPKKTLILPPFHNREYQIVDLAFFLPLHKLSVILRWS
uniref:Uncharacterized protein n=1 Tax=Oryza sativa subsp. japonica TaxID=39947 RepID=Q53KD4_ORYSJ|nr:hypothetical protein LOC_Os11g22390 [Oryza sativa Japonica Group]